MDLGLKGLRAVVTGGTKGIGRAAAELFAQEGASVAICARNGDDVKAVVKGLKAKGAQAYGADINVGDKAALQKFIANSGEALGGIDILVANVSALAAQDVEEAWAQAFDVDMMHTVNAVNAALPYLEKSNHPSIVIISSVSGREVDFTGPAYGAMKAALVHYAQRLAYQHAPKMIRVNSVSPGNTYFDGGFWQSAERNLPDLFKQALALNPDRADGESRGDRPRHRLSRQPRVELHKRNESGDRRSAHARRSALDDRAPLDAGALSSRIAAAVRFSRPARRFASCAAARRRR